MTLSRNQIYALIIIIVLGAWIMKPYFEGFSIDTTEFVNVGAPRYGLRSDLLKQHWIGNDYMSNNRQIILSDSNADYTMSSYTPDQQGIKGCKKTGCPVNGYDSLDTCYKCNNSKPTPSPVYEVWPHVKN